MVLCFPEFMRNITPTRGVAPARAYLDGTIEPGKVFDRTIGIDEVAADYRAMAGREPLKVLIRR